LAEIPEPGIGCPTVRLRLLSRWSRWRSWRPAAAEATPAEVRLVGEQGRRISQQSATSDGKAKATSIGRGAGRLGLPSREGRLLVPELAVGLRDLTPQRGKRTCTDRVCAARQGTECVLTPAAQAWMNASNKTSRTAGTASASRSGADDVRQGAQPADYGAPLHPRSHCRATSRPAPIAESFMLQDSPKVRAAECSATPNQMLDALVAGLRTTPTPTHRFFRRDGTAGHAVTPYAVQTRAAASSRCSSTTTLPGITPPMSLRTATGTPGATRPPPGARHQVPSSTRATPARATLVVIPPAQVSGCSRARFCAAGLSATRPSVPTPAGGTRRSRFGPPTGWPWRPTASTTRTFSNRLAGASPGYVGDRLSRDPRRARPAAAHKPELAAAGRTHLYVPHGPQYSITIDGSEPRGSGHESVSVIGPGSPPPVSDIAREEGRAATCLIGAQRHPLAYRGAGKQTQSPDIEARFRRSLAANKTISVATHKLERGRRKASSSPRATSSG